MFHAVITNPNHGDYGIATITLPIPTADYENVMEILGALKVGDTREADIRIDEVYNCLPTLKCLEGALVNLDELDYLAKRLESYIEYETAQFQAMAHKLDIRSVPDLINLSYCCQLATVVTDVTDLDGIGRTHLINLNGGSIAISELEKADLKATALELLNSGSGTVTPYGIVYDNGLELIPVYDGHHLPRYNYSADLITVALTSKADGSNTPNTTWIYLPCPESCIERAVRRSGITFEQMQFSITDSALPDSVESAITFEGEGIRDLNSLAWSIRSLSREKQGKFAAVVSIMKPERAMQICRIAEHLDEFEFAPNVHSPEEYGRYLMQKTTRYKYDPALDDLYDYEGLGRRHIEQEHGVFTEYGYVACPGIMSPFEQVAPELRTLKLYMPLTAEMYHRNRWGDIELQETPMYAGELLAYESEIISALEDYRTPDETERGIMQWYDERDSVNEKVRSAVFTAEERSGKLWGVAECRVAGTLTADKLAALKDYITGQAADGWGEGFEQHAVQTDEGEMYVHLWNSDDWSIRTEDELFGQGQADGVTENYFEMEMM